MQSRLIWLALVVVVGACGKVEDKPPGPGDECAINADCTDPALPFCIGTECAASCDDAGDCTDPTSPVCAGDGACVGCEDAADCAGATAPICDTDTRACRGCSRDAECAGGVCIEAEGGCVADADVAFVADLGDDTSGCTRATPCATLIAALAAVPTKRVVHVLGGTLSVPTLVRVTGDRVLDGSDTALQSGSTVIEISAPSTVIVEGFRLSAPAGGMVPAISAVGFGTKAVFHDLEIAGNGGIGVLANNSAELTLTDSRIGTLTSQNPTEVQCINANIRVERCVFETAFVTSEQGACEGIVRRNRFESSRDRSVQLTGGPIVIENNLIIHRDGFNDSLAISNVRPGSTIRFNTLINTTALPSDGAALFCDNTVEVTSNVFAYNSGHPITGLGCSTRFSVFDDVATTSAGTGNRVTGIDTIFVNRGAGDFHLAPASVALEAAEPGLDMVEDDFEGNPRPSPAGTTADSGAFEAP